MFESFVNQFDTMTLGEELYTLCFTAFMIGGTACCCLRCMKPDDGPKAPEPLPREHRLVEVRVKQPRPSRRKAAMGDRSHPRRPRVSGPERHSLH